MVKVKPGAGLSIALPRGQAGCPSENWLRHLGPNHDAAPILYLYAAIGHRMRPCIHGISLALEKMFPPPDHDSHTQEITSALETLRAQNS